MGRVIFLDYNSTTPVDEKVLTVMLPYFNRFFGNAASKAHAYGWEADAAVEKARGQVASLINCEKREIIFTSGSTEGINIALYGVMHNYKSKGNHIITCETEHKAVLDTVKALEEEGFIATYLKVDKEGKISMDELQKAITPSTVMVCIMMANNETGTIQPVDEIGALCKEQRVLFFCDATQAAGKVNIDINRIQCDLLSLSAHKMYGPKGTGALYIRRKNPSVKLKPLLTGGGHENGLRPGTLNVPGIVGMGAAAELAAEMLWEDASRLSKLRTFLEQSLEASFSIHINGSIRDRLCNTSNISFPGVQAAKLIAALPTLAFSTGSACTSALPQPSHVLRSMGLVEEQVFCSARFSLGRPTTQEEIEIATEWITKALQKAAAT